MTYRVRRAKPGPFVNNRAVSQSGVKDIEKSMLIGIESQYYLHRHRSHLSIRYCSAKNRALFQDLSVQGSSSSDPNCHVTLRRSYPVEKFYDPVQTANSYQPVQVKSQLE
ncbi:hypothetical protein J6590_079574 [Homalodisca vitripennis]|nr:hypothetical protein J6590_079574 [Homalodisca vitripennis]